MRRWFDALVTPAPLVLADARLLGGDAPVDVLLRDGVVVAVGPGLATPRGGERVALAGRWLVPGLWDQHVHLTQWSSSRQRLDLAGARSAAQAAALVAARLAEAPPPAGRPLLGRDFRDALWPDEPTAALLDAVVGDVPVVLVSGDLHGAWLSSAGLRWFGLPDHPTGRLREGEWLSRMGALDVVPDAVLDGWVREAAEGAAARGVVGVVDYEVADNVEVWRRRVAGGFDVLRVRAGVWEPHLDGVVAAGLRAGDAIAAGVTQGPLKVISDGALNTRSAFCADPYPGTDGHGVLNVPPEHLRPLMARAHAAGLTCAIHAIGDRANTLVLDAFEATGARGSVEHAQLLAADDVARFAQLGVVASVQPEHAMDDRDVADVLWAGRTDRAFPLRALDEAGVRLVLGSDAPVAPLDPWAALVSAVTRSRDGRPPWHPEQRLDAVVALAASTDGRGVVPAVGAPADLAVLDGDPLALLAAGEGDAVRAMPVAGTLLGGRWTHRAW